MKKVVVLLCFAVILASCTLDDTTIINNSSETVTVTFRHAGRHVLAPGAPPISVSTVAGMTITYTPEEWVAVNHNEGRSIIIFYDRESFPFSVRNFSGVPAILTINGYFMRVPKDVNNDNCDRRVEKLSIPVPISTLSNSSSEPQNAGFIYTRYPYFSASEDAGGSPLPVFHRFYGKYLRVSIGFLHGTSAVIGLPGGTNP